MAAWMLQSPTGSVYPLPSVTFAIRKSAPSAFNAAAFTHPCQLLTSTPASARAVVGETPSSRATTTARIRVTRLGLLLFLMSNSSPYC